MSGAEASSESVGSAVAVPLQLDLSSRSARKRLHSGQPEDPADRHHKKRREQDIRRERADAVVDNIISGAQHDSLEYIQDPLSSRRLYPKDANAAIRHIQSSLPTDDLFRTISWKVKQKAAGYVCKVNIPDLIPLRSFETAPASSRDEAESHACYQLCLKLYMLGHSDGLFSQLSETPISEVSDIEHEVAKSSSTTRRYMKKHATSLTETQSITLGRLFPLVVLVEASDGQRYAPLLILARIPFPHLANFRVFFSGAKGVVQLHRAASFDIDHQKLNLLHRYTLRLSRSIINKPIECRPESVPLFFAPLAVAWEDIYDPEAHWSQLPEVASHIPWPQVEVASEAWATSLQDTEAQRTNSPVSDWVVQDRSVEFTNRHYVLKVRHDLNPMSKAEDSSREAGYENFVEYCKARRKDFEGVKDPNQPMIEVSQVAGAVNNLAPACGSVPAQQKSALKYLIPELCFKLVIPASVLRTALLLPSITHMIERMLVTKELNARYFDNAIVDEHLLAALSPPTAGVEHDYDRLELLGDAYLKFVTSAYLYATMPGEREGALNHARGQLVSNKALHVGALQCGLPPYIQSKALITKVWLPYIQTEQGESEKGVERDMNSGPPETAGEAQKSQSRYRGGKRKKQLDEQSVQWLGDKTVADVVEAILGAAFVSGGHNLALRATKVLRINMPKINVWSDLPCLPPSNRTRSLSQATFKAVEKIIGYEFKQQAYLAEALTHATAAGGSSNYERLEFLGDAVLDMLTVSYIFEKYPLSGPGALSLLKAAMVSNSSLATVCILTGLHEHIQYSGGGVRNAIAAHTNRIRKLRDEEYKRARSEGRLPVQFWLEAEPPKILSDIVEAVIGAIFVSEGYELDAVQEFFDRVIKPFYVRHIRLQTLSRHPSTTLFELLQAEHCREHGIRKEVANGGIRCHVVVHDTVVATGVDRASGVAARKAALAALDVLTNDPSLMSRLCSCKTAQGAKKAQKKSALGYDDDEDAQAVERELIGPTVD